MDNRDAILGSGVVLSCLMTAAFAGTLRAKTRSRSESFAQ
jgi:hypothetical protein